MMDGLRNSHYLAALAIARHLRALGHEAYFAGGCVRDLLLGREPLDFDVATSATPEQVQAAFPRTESVGAHFGVVLVIDQFAAVPQGLKPPPEISTNVRAEARTYQVEDVTASTCQIEEKAVAQTDQCEEAEEGTSQASRIATENAEDSASPPQRIATEVATFRHDGAYTDGRRPDAVRFSLDAREDVLRRDFTINGLLLDPILYDAGNSMERCVLDYVHGRDDLAAGIVRAIGDPVTRFTEDKLRMLRAVRFAARLGFTLEAQTFAAIRQLAPQIHSVSVERIRDEITRILTEGSAARGLQLLHGTGLLAEVLPEVTRLQGVEQPADWHPEGDVWVHTLMLLDHLPANAPATLAWGMLLHDIGKPATFNPPTAGLRANGKPDDRIRFNGHVEVGLAIARGMLARLRFSNDDTAAILALVQHHMQFGDIKKMRQSTLKRFLRLPDFDAHLALHRADCLSSHGSLEMYDFARQQIDLLTQEGLADQLRPVPLLTGNDLIAAGYRPGPAFALMLLVVEDAQLEGRILTQKDALALVAQAFGQVP